MRFFWRPIVLNDPEPKILAGSMYTKDEVLHEIRVALNSVRGHHMDPETGWLDYAGLAVSKQFAELEGGVGLLHKLHLEEVGGESEKIAFWINVYNLLAIHAIVLLSIHHSVLQVPFYFRRVRYRIGGKTFSLSEIEKILGQLDLRSTFAINFGSVSCGITRAYDYQDTLLNVELDQAVREALESVHIHEGDQTIVLPALMGRWKSMGKGDRDIIAWCFPYLGSDTQREISKRPNYSVKFAQFDFSLNRAHGVSRGEPPLAQS